MCEEDGDDASKGLNYNSLSLLRLAGAFVVIAIGLAFGCAAYLFELFTKKAAECWAKVGTKNRNADTAHLNSVRF